MNKTSHPLQTIGENLGVTPVLDMGGKQFKKVGNFTAKQVDRAMVSNVKVVLRMIGGKLNALLHDDAMPVKLHLAINTIFGSFWPEIQKGVLDKLLLEKGWQFRNYRMQLHHSQAQIPSGFAWLHSTLIYSQMPYDRTFWGLIRSPLFLAVRLLFLFPLFGVDSLCVIAYWLSAEKLDEHQLVAFIIKSKSLAFITAGLLSGAIGFIKLYLCATKWDAHGPGSCERKAPGMNATFWFEYFLFLVRTVLVWVTFVLLWCFEEILAWKRKRDAERNRLMSSARRGLFAVKTTRIILLCTWLLSWYNMVACLSAADYFSAAVATAKHTTNHHAAGGLSAILSNFQATTVELTLPPIQAAILIFPLQQLPCSILLNIPQSKPYGALLGASISFFVLVFVLRNLYIAVEINDAVNKNVDEVISNLTLIVLSLFTLTVMIMLVIKQFKAKKHDIEAVARFEQVMVNLDRDGDGEVSKAEFRVAFKELFPDAQFEPVWKRLDQDGDGSLSMAELANHFGMGHLVSQQDVQVENKDSDDDMEDMFSVESKLDSTVEASALSHRAGGVLPYFLIWDLVAFAIVGTFVALPLIRKADDSLDSQWRLRTGLYFSKELLGLMSLPFLIFQMPVIKDALTHTKKTGYDRSGKCVAVLNKTEKSKRYAILQEGRKQRYSKMKAGMYVSPAEALELHWNAFLGFPQLDKKTVNDAKKKVKLEEKLARKGSLAGADFAKAAKTNML